MGKISKIGNVDVDLVFLVLFFYKNNRVYEVKLFRFKFRVEKNYRL